MRRTPWNRLDSAVTGITGCDATLSFQVTEITESKVGEPLYRLEAFLDVFGFVYILIR
jgi:hypothetical protein